MRAARSATGAALLALAALVASCRLPDYAAPGAPANVVVDGQLAYAALGADGLGIYDVATGRPVGFVRPPAGAGSVDDLALADGWLFALDARSPGRLAAFSLADATQPALAGATVEVPVGPFSGVAAAAGRVIVSGGTSELTIWSYDAAGTLAGPTRLDLGRGQPDVTVAADGRLAIVSTHFRLIQDTFGLTLLGLEEPPRVLATVEIDAAGFSPGGARPSSFPLTTALSGSALFAAHGGGLSIYDVDEPSAPRLVVTHPCGFHPVGVAARGTLVAVVGSDPEPMLLLLDVTQPAQPVELARGRFGAGAQPTAVALADATAVVATLGGGLAFVALPGDAARVESADVVPVTPNASSKK